MSGGRPTYLFWAYINSLYLINKMLIIRRMIKSFNDSETERLFATGKSRRLPQEILRRAIMRLAQLDAATWIEDLRLPPSNRL